VNGRPLSGRRVVTTRDRQGKLEQRLLELGAEIVHVALVSITPGDAGALAAAIARLEPGDWVVVSSQHGAARVAPLVSARGAELRTAAVGTRTAEVLASGTGRATDVVPRRQTAADLVAVMPPGTGCRAVVAQADRAAPTLVDGLRELGYAVEPVTAYRTGLRRPTARQRVDMLAADAVAFASGSAADSWADAIGTVTPPVVVAIGPTTAAAAERRGLRVTHVAAEHAVDGLVDAIVAALRRGS
jgi:uroporphyrinogen-III synthase